MLDCYFFTDRAKKIARMLPTECIPHIAVFPPNDIHAKGIWWVDAEQCHLLSPEHLQHTVVIEATEHLALTPFMKNNLRFYITEDIDAPTLSLLIPLLRTAQSIPNLKHPCVPGLFQFKTLEDARSLAEKIAYQCDDPNNAILGLMELLVNAIEHGNLEVGYDLKSALTQHHNWLPEIQKRLQTPPYCERYITVSIEQNHNYRIIHIADQGQGFNWRKFKELDPSRKSDQHGRGIFVATQLSVHFGTEIKYNDNGNMVTVKIPRPVARDVSASLRSSS